MIGDIKDTALLGDLTRALAESRERTRQALDAALVLQGRVVQLEAYLARVVIIADEAFGPTVDDSFEATLTRLELGCYAGRREIELARATIEALRCGDLALYLDGELEKVAPDRARAFAEHLERCADCQANKADIERIDARMRAARPR